MGRVRGLVRDTGTVFVRECTPELRAPVGLVIAMGQPLLFLFLFGPLLAGTAAVGEATWQWFVPGILVMMCLFGPMAAGHHLLVELNGGSWERILATPVDRTALLLGRSLKESAVLLAQAVLIIAIGALLGARLDLVGALAGMAILVVFGIGLSALSFVLAIASRPTGDLFWIVTQVLVLPLVLLSGLLLPTELGPPWLQVVAAVNPAAHVVDALRALVTGGLTDVAVGRGAAVATAVAVLGLVLGTRAMRRGL